MNSHIDYQSAEDQRDVVVDVISRLAEGEVMQTTIDTGVVQVGWSQRPAAIERMAGNLKAGQHLCLCVAGYHQALDYLEEISDMGRRLMTRCWPGGLQLEVPVDLPFGLLEGLPSSTQQRLSMGRRLRLLSPKSQFIRDLQKLLSGPLVLTSPVPVAKVSATSPPSGDEELPAGCDFCVETGPCHSTQGPTIVELKKDDWSVVQPGMLTRAFLKQMTGTSYLFVCTGNTCRSPMAEGLFRKMLAEKLQCETSDLPEKGYLVGSAGVSAGNGYPASPEAVQLLLDEGVNIGDHTSRQLSEELLDQTDHILTLTNSHRQAILMSRPDLEGKIRLLSPEGRDVSDPIGGGLAEYEACKSEIESYLKLLLDEIE
ncbi:MAG: Sua5/YciO/YrdC/YwlC family protein [Planctomycetaceae bacterium]|nr:Sua5/YciO/YrdC/YwlC family protein [Planctomycetaceae bacterium]